MNCIKIFDTHCDTISKIYEFGGNLFENDYQVDIKRMKRFENFAQVFAIFTDKNELSEKIIKNELNLNFFEFTLNLIKRYFAEIELNFEAISHCENAIDITYAFEQNKIAAMLAIEGGEVLCGSLENLQKLYDLGVRILTLTWNYDNELGSGAYGDGGLTNFGKVVIREMNRLGMIIDVSHLNEAGFWDVIQITDTPVIASHSNAYACCKHPRNLTDKQISALADMQGYIGLNLYSDFLNDDKNACITDVVRHVEHFKKLGAGEILGLGCDFDGVDKLPLRIAGAQDICKLPINEDIAFNNFYKYIWRVL